MAKPGAMDFEKKTVITPTVRASFVSLFKKKKYKGNETKYGMMIIIPKDADISGFKKAARNAKIEKFGKEESEWPEFRSFLRDGEKKYPGVREYKGAWIMNVNRKEPPEVLDRDKTEITAEQASKFYSGCYCQCRLVASVYEKDDKWAVSFALLAAKKVSEGPKLGNASSADRFEDTSADDEESSGASDSEDGEESDDEESGYGF